MQQEDAMRRSFQAGVAVTAMLAGLGFALAQQPPANDKLQTPQAEKAQKDSQQTQEGKAGTTEPSSNLPSDQPKENAVFINGALAVPGAPTEGETVPAKFSEQNAARDQVPIMAKPLPLSDEQKRRIYDTVSGANKPIANVDAHPANFLPPSIELFELPSELANAIPAVRDLKYVRLDDRVLLVQPPNKVVVGEIPR
jgi:hypothetical protein